MAETGNKLCTKFSETILQNGKGLGDDMFLEKIRSQTKTVVNELLQIAKLQPGEVLVVGCSSSEIGGYRIGTNSNADIGKAVFDVLFETVKQQKIYLAAQCCEHLNRCLILEKSCAEAYGLELVNAVPMINAGGAFATAAYQAFSCPVTVESVIAHAGIDIGDTFIGMHLRRVVVPVRTTIKEIGNAHVTCARTRLKLVGGARTSYQ